MRDGIMFPISWRRKADEKTSSSWNGRKASAHDLATLSQGTWTRRESTQQILIAQNPQCTQACLCGINARLYQGCDWWCQGDGAAPDTVLGMFDMCVQCTHDQRSSTQHNALEMFSRLA